MVLMVVDGYEWWDDGVGAAQTCSRQHGMWVEGY